MATRKISKAAIILLTAIGAIITATTAGLLTASQTLSSGGNVQVTAVGVGIYSDSACTLNLTSISWGTIKPGEAVTRTIYVKNTGNTPITLSMATNTWAPPEANGPIAITWDKEAATLNAGNSTAAVLTLSVSSSITGVTNFSVNIIITGTG